MELAHQRVISKAAGTTAHQQSCGTLTVVQEDTGDQQPTNGDQQPTNGDQQPTNGDQQPTNGTQSSILEEVPLWFIAGAAAFGTLLALLAIFV